MNSKTLSEKLITHNKNNKADFFIWTVKKTQRSSVAVRFTKSIIKDYKLTDSKGDYMYDGETFTLFNTNQYNFTDIRNTTYQKGFEYIEE